MRMRRHLSPQELEPLVVISLICLLISVLFPTLDFRLKAGHCQSNMSRIGKALKMYLADWDDTYPVNGSPRKPSSSITIDDPGKFAKGSAKFKHGLNWVEALQPYVEKVSEGGAGKTWACPVAYRFMQKEGYVTYAFNANLAGGSDGIVRNSGKLMSMRELSGRDHAVLRPKIPSLSAKTPPDDPFLNADETIPDPRYKLHLRGSHILFADGHVKRFGMKYFPEACQWDGKDKQWYNFVKLPAGDARNKSIAVSP